MVETKNKSSYEKPYNLEPNVEAALSYLLTPFTGIAVFVMEKEDAFVRFHAFQSILFGIASFALWSVASTLTTILIGYLLLPIVSLICAGTWVLLMWKAYNKEEFKLPIIGDIAKKQAGKKS